MVVILDKKLKQLLKQIEDLEKTEGILDKDILMQLIERYKIADDIEQENIRKFLDNQLKNEDYKGIIQ
jgi:hypothetical protein